MQLRYVPVGGHDLQDLRRRERAFRVHAAPPEHGFGAPQRAHAAVQPQHLAQRGVHAALEPVVRAGDRAFGR